jgi:hypothetical protein
MNINIPQNTFEHKEPREEMVQKICDIFLMPDSYECFQVATDCLGETTKVIRNSRYTDKPEFTTKKFGDDPDSFIRESEMQSAFDVLRAAGYHVFRDPRYGNRTAGYKVVREDYMPGNWYEVDGLMDHWDK